MTKVQWGDALIEWDEAKRLTAEAKELSKEFNLSTTETRHWYEDSYEVPVTDYSELARFIQKIKETK